MTNQVINSFEELMTDAKKRTMSAKEIVLVSQWLAKNKDRLNGTNRIQRVSEIYKDIAVRCTEPQLARVEGELGYSFKASRQPSGSIDRAALLAAALIKLFEQCGEEPPKYLHSIRKKESADSIRFAIHG